MKSDSLGQLILTGIPGKQLDSATAKLFQRVQPGAFILFGRNIESAPQLRKLIDDLRDLSEVEPIITVRSEEHTSELQSRFDLVCRLLLEKKKASDEQVSAFCSNELSVATSSNHLEYLLQVHVD